MRISTPLTALCWALRKWVPEGVCFHFFIGLINLYVYVCFLADVCVGE